MNAEAGRAKGMSRHLIIRHVKRFLAQEDGATLVEYAMLAVLISITAVTILVSIGLAVRGTFQGVIAEIDKTKAGG